MKDTVVGRRCSAGDLIKRKKREEEEGEAGLCSRDKSVLLDNSKEICEKWKKQCAVKPCGLNTWMSDVENFPLPPSSVTEHILKLQASTEGH